MSCGTPGHGGEGQGRLREQRLTSHQHGIGKMRVPMPWSGCLGQRRGASVQWPHQWLRRGGFGEGGLAKGDVNLIQAGPIRTGSGRGKSCKGKLHVRGGSRGVPKDLLNQGLNLRPGAQEGSRGMEGRTPEAKTTPAAG